MRTFDASSLIYTWDFYPPDQFPKLWAWIGENVEDGEFTTPAVAFKETLDRLPECAQWLKDRNIVRLATESSVLGEALRLKNLLGIVEDAYGLGVGENDLLIIATARVHKVELISQEARQLDLPKRRDRFKIPAVCSLPEVLVPCRNVIELIKASKKVFA